MIIVGLTGSVGMGKSTVAAQFAKEGAAVFDADAIVHNLLLHDAAVIKSVANAFPEAVISGKIDRRRLGEKVFGNILALRTLEALLHPRVQEQEQSFLKRARKQGKRFVVLDIPLLFETGADARTDATVTVSAPAFVQRQRVLARPGMNEEKFSSILARQQSDVEKRRQADFIISTGLGKGYSLAGVKRVVRMLKGL